MTDSVRDELRRAGMTVLRCARRWALSTGMKRESEALDLLGAVLRWDRLRRQAGVEFPDEEADTAPRPRPQTKGRT